VNFSGNVHPALVTQAMLLALIALDFGERNLLPISVRRTGNPSLLPPCGKSSGACRGIEDSQPSVPW